MKAMAGPLSLAGRLAGTLRQSGRACAGVVESPRFASAALLVVVASELVVLLSKASRKPFWYDELIAFDVSSLRPFSLLWSALQAGADSTPPGYYILVQLARTLPGDPHVIFRLPSILGYVLTLLGVYWFARKRLPVSAGLTAVVLIALTPFREYAFEARPYSLLVGFLAISAVFWQRIGEKRFMTLLFALFLVLAVSSHHLAVVAISAFGAAELARTLLSRRIRWGVWAACLSATCAFLVGLPLLLHYRNIFAEHYWSRPGWSRIVLTYGAYLGLHSRLALVSVSFFGILAGGSLLRMLRRSREGSPERDFDLPEMVLLGGFLLYPALLVVLAKVFDGGYTPRYGWPAILGLVLGFVYLFRGTKLSSALLLVALLAAFTVRSGYDFTVLSKAGWNRVDERWTRLAELSRGEPGIPVVIACGHTYLEATEYAPPELRERLVQVVDADMAARLIGSNTGDKVNRILARFLPLRVEDLAPFQTANQKFLLYSGGSRDWLTQYLAANRYNMKLLSQDGDFSVYIVER